MIPSLRLDKFLFLIRAYVNAGFAYLAHLKWKDGLLEEYVDLMKQVPLSVENLKVSDGLRYHVLDVWVDELLKITGENLKGCPVEKIMEPVGDLAIRGKTKPLRKRAKETLGDERLPRKGEEDAADKCDEGDRAFQGFQE